MRTNLKAMTFSKKAKSEIVALLPNAASFKKLHVAGIGYVFYIKNAAGETIAKCWKEPMSPMTLEA